MDVTETLSEGLKREFKVVVGGDEIDSKLTDKLTTLSKEIQMPGFRKGKVPVPLLRKTYGSRVMGEVIEETVRDGTQQAIDSRELKPALVPNIEITQYEEGANLEYKISLEVLPDVEPMDFSTLSLTRQVCAVSDDLVDERLKSIADGMRNFSETPDDQTAADGDAVIIDFKGSVDGEAFDGGAAEDFQLELGSGRFIPGFEEQLVGWKKGDNNTITVTFPEDYGSADLAGKEAQFDVTVKEVKVPLPVPIDDSLASNLGMENLEELKSKIQGDVERNYADMSRMKLKRVLLDQLAENHSFVVPEGMVNQEFDSIWKEVEQDLEKQEKTFDDLDKSEDEMRSEYQAIAERRVRLGLLLSEVSRRNSIEVTDDEVKRAVVQEAVKFPGQEQQVIGFFQENPEAQAQLRAPILEDKVVDFILEMATVEDETVELAELLKDPDDENDTAAEAASADESDKKSDQS